MKKYNLSEIMKRAWELVKKSALTIGSALRQAWKEAKENMVEKSLIEILKSNLEKMAYENPSIHAGMDRTVSAKYWEKGEAKRTYLAINCYTLAGRFKGSYKCGYVDMVTGKYVCGKYDEVDAANSEYLGRR